MANYKSSKKRIRVNERNHQRNVMIRSRVKTATKKVYTALESKESENINNLVLKAVSELDKAGSKGVLHKNTIARRKSRMMKRINQAKGA